jgi:hypothetical protein
MSIEGLKQYTTEDLVAEVQRRILAFHDMEAGFLRLLSTPAAPASNVRTSKGYVKMALAKQEQWDVKRKQADELGITLGEYVRQQKAKKKAVRA